MCLLLMVMVSAGAQTMTANITTIPSNHNGAITITVTGAGWTAGTTTISATGGSGYTTSGGATTSATTGTILITPGAVLPGGTASTGPIVLHNSTDAATATITVGTPSISLDSVTNYVGFSRSVAITGTNTIWSSETAATLFTISTSNGSYTTMAARVASNTSASQPIGLGTAPGTITVTDASTGATGSLTVVAYSMPTITSSADLASLPGARVGYRMDATSYKDAAKTSPVTTNGDLIYVIPNQVTATGSTFDLVQATSGNRPVYLASALNGLPGATLNSKLMATTGNVLDSSMAGSWTVFAVSKTDAATNSQNFLFNFNTVSIFGWNRLSVASLTNTLVNLNVPTVGSAGPGPYGTSYTSINLTGILNSTGGGGTPTYLIDDSYAATQAMTFNAGSMVLSSNLSPFYVNITSPLSSSISKSGALSGTGAMKLSDTTTSISFKGSMEEIWVFNQGFPPALRIAVEKMYAAKYATAPLKQYVFEGDSKTNQPAFATCYPGVVAGLLPGGQWRTWLTGTGGWAVKQILQNVAARDLVRYEPLRSRNVIEVEACTNDFVLAYVPATTQGGTDLYNNYYKPLVGILRAQGYRVIIDTCVPRDGQSLGYRAFNTALRADWTANGTNIADGFCDVAADTNIGDNGSGTDSSNNNHNLTYYQGDFTHPTTAGAAIYAGYSNSAVLGTAYAQNPTQPGIDNGLFAGTLGGPGSFSASSNTFTFAPATGGTGTVTTQLQRAPSVVYSDANASPTYYNCPGTFADVSGVSSTSSGGTLVDTSSLTTSTRYWWRLKTTDGNGVVNYSNFVNGVASSAAAAITTRRTLHSRRPGARPSLQGSNSGRSRQLTRTRN